MVNSININHSENEIMASSEGVLYLKLNDVWNDISDKNLYKSEYKYPTSDIGNDGDYFVKYIRKYNLIKYSNEFSNPNYWYSNNLIVSPDLDISFANTNATKLIPSKTNSEHNLTYTITNDISSKQSAYTFSLYAEANELNKIALSMVDGKENYGIRCIFNTLTFTKELSYIGVTPGNESSFTKFGITSNELSDIDYEIESYDEGYVRIWITCRFKTTKVIKLKINVLNNNGQLVYPNTTETDGIFINGAQLVKGNKPTNFIVTNNYGDYFLDLEKFYCKESGEWVEYDNRVIYFNDLPNNKVGNNGDIACQDALIHISPMVKFGTSLNIKSPKPEGIIFWNQKIDSYYVKGKKGLYKLMFKNAKPNNYGVSMAVSLSNKSYNTWCSNAATPHMQPKGLDFRKGFNTGGSVNFWNRNKARI